MASDLKTENSKSVFLILAASLVLSSFLQASSISLPDWIELLIVGSGSLMLSVVLIMLTNILPQSIKHKLVFTRYKDELPACRVDALCKKDIRVEYKVIAERWPEVFSEDIGGAIRNSRWHQQIYQPVKQLSEVSQAHRSFLLYRDAFTGLLLILLGTVTLSLIDHEAVGEIKSIVFYLQTILVLTSLLAARVAGNRFVVNAVVAAQ